MAMTIDRETYRSWLLGLAVWLPLMIGACDPAETADADLEGLWRSQGYGLIIENTGSESRLIETTPVSCLLSDQEPIEAFQARLVDLPDAHRQSFALGSKATLSVKRFDRLDDNEFKGLCPDGLTESTSDPALNFEVLWQTFDQHYAFFGERNVDWDAVHAQLRPTITKNMSNRELRSTLGRMLGQLNDAHVSLYADGDDKVWVENALYARLLDECRRQDGPRCDIDDYLEDRYEAFDEIVKTSYLDDEVETGLRGRALWGEIDERTGYFRIDAMENLAEGAYSTSEDLRAIEHALDEMLEDIGDLPTMIVDVRLNGGGHDTVAVAIASRFAGERTVFGSKRAFFEGERLAATDLVIEPAKGRHFDGAVAVLTSEETASAAEIFTMAMRALPHVTQVGSRTQGILSDELYRTLPNGWTFSLSNEIYLTHDGALFEGIGVPPDIEVEFLLPHDLEKDIDPAIDTAVALLGKQADLKERSQ